MRRLQSVVVAVRRRCRSWLLRAILAACLSAPTIAAAAGAGQGVVGDLTCALRPAADASLELPAVAGSRQACDGRGPDCAVGGALTDLGDLILNGRIDRAEGLAALAYYERLAETSDPAAITAVIPAPMLIGPALPGPADAELAFEAYRRGSELGFAEAWLRLGDIYRDGALGEVDLSRAASCYRRAAAAGSASGALAFAEMLMRGQGVSKDVDRGRTLATGLAATGDGRALILLGDLHSGGAGGPIDAAAAIRAYEDAVRAGEPAALLRLGDLYRDGRLAPRDGEKAARYYQRAAGTVGMRRTLPTS